MYYYQCKRCDYVSKQKIDMKTFIALCILENINILLVKQNSYFELEMNSQSSVQIIHYFTEKQKFGLEENTSKAIEIYGKF